MNILKRIEKLEIRVAALENKKKEKLHAFLNSPYFDKKLFKEKLPDWPVEKLAYYYQEMLDYSEINGGRYLNWLSVAKKWARRDEDEGKMKWRKKFGTQVYHEKYKNPVVDDPMGPGDAKKIKTAIDGLAGTMGEGCK